MRQHRAALARSIGAAAGLLIDRVSGEPPLSVHPVARFGSAMTALEQRTYRDHRAAGVVHLVIGAGAAGGVGLLAQRLLGRGPAAAVAVAVAAGGRMLADEAGAVAALLHRGDLCAARLRITSLVGRDTAHLNEIELARATIESVAENTVDAVIAPLWWAAVGGAPAVLAHRAINTLDAMVGHRSRRYTRYGWASARADDVVNWVPARLSAVSVAALHPARAAQILRTVRTDGRRHPSPNGGLIEAAFAAALGVTLGGTNAYAGRVEQRGVLGTGSPPQAADIARAVSLARRLTVAVTGAVVVTGLARPTRARSAA